MARPTVMTDEVVRKLAEAFKLDVSVEEACLYANISKDTYYRKLREDEGFSDEMDRARMYATMVARICVINHIQKDPRLAFKYLERKRPVEFGLRQATPSESDTDDIDLLAEARARLSPDTEQRISKFLHPPCEHVIVHTDH